MPTSIADNRAARAHGHKRGKDEAWLILAAEPHGAFVGAELAANQVEDGRLAYVRPADQGEHRLHSASAASVPSCVWISRLEGRVAGRLSGAARTAPAPLA